MIIELGHFALILAFAVAAVSTIVGFAFWRNGERITLRDTSAFRQLNGTGIGHLGERGVESQPVTEIDVQRLQRPDRTKKQLLDNGVPTARIGRARCGVY